MRIVLLFTVVALAGCATTEVDSRYTTKAVAERVEAWNNVARCYIQNGSYEQAKRPLQRALEINPQSGESLALMAFVFQRQQESDIADQYYRQALESEPDNATVNNNYGIFLMLQQRFDEACGYLALAAAEPLYAQRSQSLENLASCYRAAGDAKRSEATYRQVLGLNPNSAVALIELADLAYVRGDTAESWELFNRHGSLVRNRVAEHTAKSLWLGVRLARASEDPSMAATYALLLKSSYPDSAEYRQYKESR
nr:type IV pilus biogenesis/stability protein PilW [Motiliproteus sediminis]